MATQQDLQDLLRLLTSTRKLPMLQAMQQVKALQAADLHSIKEIAEADLGIITSAVKDDKQSRALQSACKAVLKRGDASGSKRAASSLVPTGPSKRVKTNDFMDGPVEMTPQELEASLELPLDTDEERIATTAVHTNRAPLLLAFAVELLRYTMPEQPGSSRLSLAQAVVSANSRSKAVSLGIEKGPSTDEQGWGEGQPKVHIMGREVTVLKRGGYEWRGEETVKEGRQAEDMAEQDERPGMSTADATQSTTASTATVQPSPIPPSTTWATSQSISLKDSTFVARATQLTNSNEKDRLLRALFAAHPTLRTATHNAWAFRTSGGREASFDDGETGAGALLLRMLREAGASDVFVVLTRWFGGTMLGPDRWRLMRNCVAGALAERLRSTGAEAALGGEAVWGLDLEHGRNQALAGRGGSAVVVGMPAHRPEAARKYLLKSFATAPGEGQDGKTDTKSKKKSAALQDAEKEENLGRVLGALRLVLDSWADHLPAAELDRRAWSWYCTVRPNVESGPSGWGAKGTVLLKDILALRRKE